MRTLSHTGFGRRAAVPSEKRLLIGKEQNLSWLFAILLAMAPNSSEAQPVITSFQQNGLLSWLDGGSNLAYQIQWAPSLGGTWYSSWESLCYVGPVSSGVTTVSVPMFYRVVEAANPPSSSIFVSTLGTDSAGCGDVESPCATIGFGISRADSAGRPSVAVSLGVYEEHIVLVDGINVLGGYGPPPSWCPKDGCKTVLQSDGNLSALVIANSISLPTRLEGFLLHGPTPAAAGASSIAVQVHDSSSSLVLCQY